MTSNVNDLTARIQQRKEIDRRKVDEIAERDLQALWREVERHRERQATNHRSRYGEGARADAPPAAARLAPASGDRPGGRAGSLAQHLRRELGADAVAVEPRARLLETQETYRRGIAQEQRALDQLQAQTWGVWLHEDADGTRYVVLPRGTLNEDWPVTVLGQPAIRLSSE